MAWASTVEVLQAVPFLIHKIAITNDNNAATAVAHGGPEAPFMVLPVQGVAGKTGEVAVTATSATTVTLDPETADDNFHCYCFFAAQSSGGITP